MKPDIIRFAAEVIRSSTKLNPADQALRGALKFSEAQLSRAMKRDISFTVFNYYRWKGWLTQKASVESKLDWALELASRYRTNPVTLPAEIIRAKAVPEWVWEEIPANDPWLWTLQREPKLWLRARRGKGKELVKNLGEARVAKDVLMADAVEYYGLQDLFKSESYTSGAFEVQDIASQAVGWLCDPQPRDTWWDTCAGEGGKTLHLADLLQGKGQVFASDRADWRLARLKQRAIRAGVQNYQAAEWDGGEKLPFLGPFDGVLVDAPCSGIGTWQRNPHARWTLGLKDVQELALVQRKLLTNAAPAVKPGGKLIYAVCTLTRSEGEAVAQFFNETQPGFEPMPLAQLALDEQSKLLAKPASTRMIWPQEFGGNGMFVAAWRKKTA